jgi:hypothetical protein
MASLCSVPMSKITFSPTATVSACLLHVSRPPCPVVPFVSGYGFCETCAAICVRLFDEKKELEVTFFENLPRRT